MRVRQMVYRLFQWPGKLLNGFFVELGRMSLMGLESIYWILRGRVFTPALVQASAGIGVDSLPIISFTALFTGMVLVVQVGNQFMDLGAENIIGGVVGLSLTREMSPLIVSVILAARAGTAMAAEIGTMKVTEQIDALKVMSANPISHLVVPRILACAFFTPVLVIFSNLIGILGGYVVAVSQIGVNSHLFWQSLIEMVAPHDFLGGLVKSSGFGFLVGLIGCSKGMDAAGGAKGVGRAATESVVMTITAILVCNYFFSLAFFAWMRLTGKI